MIDTSVPRPISLPWEAYNKCLQSISEEIEQLQSRRTHRALCMSFQEPIHSFRVGASGSSGRCRRRGWRRYAKRFANRVAKRFAKRCAKRFAKRSALRSALLSWLRHRWPCLSLQEGALRFVGFLLPLVCVLFSILFSPLFSSLLPPLPLRNGMLKNCRPEAEAVGCPFHVPKFPKSNFRDLRPAQAERTLQVQEEAKG